MCVAMILTTEPTKAALTMTLISCMKSLSFLLDSVDWNSHISKYVANNR